MVLRKSYNRLRPLTPCEYTVSALDILFLIDRKDPSKVQLETSHTAEVLAILSMEKFGITNRKITETSLLRPWSSTQV